ncbi:hypothetical protein D3C77_614190 [compost metagenome]
MEGNISKMAEVLKKVWLTDKGSVNSTCSVIIAHSDEYKDEDSQAEHAKYIFEHIESKELGKAMYSQELTNYIESEIKKINHEELDQIDKLDKMTKVFNIPSYVRNAVIWSCGYGEKDE